MNYNPDIFFKEMYFPQFDEQLLSRTKLPEFTENERQLYEATLDPSTRRTMVSTPEGIVKTAFYKNKGIADRELVSHTKDLLQLEQSKEIHLIRQWAWGSHTTTAHTDYLRDSQLLYITDPGGPNVETHWFIEPGEPLIRPWKLAMHCIDDTRHFEKVCSTVLKPNTWYYFNTAILHSVTNMVSERVAFSVVSKGKAPVITPI